MWFMRLGCRQRSPYRLLAAGCWFPRLPNYSVCGHCGESGRDPRAVVARFSSSSKLDERTNHVLTPDFKSKPQVLALFRKDGRVPKTTILSRMLSTSEASESGVQTEPVRIGVGSCEELLEEINNATLACNKALDVKRLRQEYRAEVRHLILPCCLITPGALNHKDTAFLAFQTYLMTKRDPQFISSYELMVRKKTLPDPEMWMSFIRHLMAKRVFVVEDWTRKNIGNIEVLFYDYGPKEAPGSMELYRGEVDASFKAGKATLSIVIWKGDKIVWSEVYKDVPCSSIVVAEAYAALALIFRCVELGIKNLVMWTDNEAVCQAVTGVLTVRTGSDDHDLLMLLGYTRRMFTKLVCLWKPREVMFLSDDISRDPMPQYAQQVLDKWSYQLSGKPLYKITQAAEATSIINNFVCREYNKREKKYFMTVDHSKKLEAVVKLKETFCPSLLYVAIDRLEEKPLAFQEVIRKLFPEGCAHVVKQCTIMGQNVVSPDAQEGGESLVSHDAQEGGESLVSPDAPDDGKHLLVVCDSILPPDCYDHLGAFTVILVTPQERPLVKGVKELNALSYSYFHGVKGYPVIEQQELKWKDWKKAVSVASRSSSSSSS